MLALIGGLIALAWLSRPDDESAIDTDSWSPILSARNRTAAAERLKKTTHRGGV